MGTVTSRTWVRSSTPARVDDILAKAREVLIRDGYTNFNLRKVAIEVGVRLATVQYHFADRDTLLRAAVTTALEQWGDGFLNAAAQTERSAEDRLREVQRLNLEFLETPSTAPLLVECFALAQHNEVVRDAVQFEYFKYRKLLVHLMREIRPDLSSEELMGFAMVFAAQSEGLVLLLRRDDPHRPNEAMLRRALDSQFDGFVEALRAYRSSGAARTARGKAAVTRKRSSKGKKERR